MFTQYRLAARGIALACFVGLATALFWGPCRRRSPQIPGKPSVPAIQLAPDEKEKIQVDTRKREVTYAVRKPDGTVEVKVIRGVRRATITETNNGEIKVAVRRWGFCLEPGIGGVIDNGPHVEGDVQWFYFDNWGASTGLYYNTHLRVFIGGLYTLSRLRLVNTSLWVGGNFQKEIVFGVRFGF